MGFYFYEKVGTIFKEPVLLIDLPGTVKTEARVFSKKHKKHTLVVAEPYLKMSKLCRSAARFRKESCEGARQKAV